MDKGQIRRKAQAELALLTDHITSLLPASDARVLAEAIIKYYAIASKTDGLGRCESAIRVVSARTRSRFSARTAKLAGTRVRLALFAGYQSLPNELKKETDEE